MEVLLYFLTGAGIGGLLTYLSTRIGRKGMEVNLRILREKAKAWEEKEQRWQEEKMAWIRDNERLKENLRQTEEKWRGQKEEILQIAALQKEQFQNLANDILEDKSRRFTEANRENIERILGPLNKDIQEFRKKVEESYSKETVERTVLERKIAELVQLNNRIREDAVNLTNALKGNTKTQGDWGEMILERILENSGLTKGREYFIQETLKDESDRVIRTENGNTMRPDVIVVYPDNRKVIIDSKVSLTAYVDYCNAETETEREVALKAHLLSVRKHIDELSARNYCDWCDGALDFVMLFIPNESSYVLAMQSEPTLWHEAYRKRVLLLSPSNLIVSLKLTADLWSREYQNRHAQEIAERGAKLYDKCVAFLESLTAIGDNIQRTEESYRQALNRLKEGNGNLISQTLKLKELGVKSRRGDKEIPEELVTEYSAQYTSYYQQYASYFGMEFSDFLTQYMNQTEDDFNKDAADYGKQVAGNMLVVCAIAKAEKIDPDALYDEKVAQYAKQSGYSDVATLEKDYSQKYLRQVIINEEVLNVLEENAVAVAPTETESEASK